MNRSSGSPSDVGSFSVSWVWVAAGIVFGAKVQNVIGQRRRVRTGRFAANSGTTSAFTRSLTRFPVIPRSKYRLEVTGLVDRSRTYTINDLESMPRTTFVMA